MKLIISNSKIVHNKLLRQHVSIVYIIVSTHSFIQKTFNNLESLK
ncbi:hypothetical protein EV142_102170 [Flavobacterium circumlabens]|uniref:Uncharacterized protein n=1 Tax=Flavobacterium circumlabens TaxID=2133765 RepID=A0ABY2B157_9FLAO|nr:hypothetical protein EV142_102170 [Flavobacterium circumlabens]